MSRLSFGESSHSQTRFSGVIEMSNPILLRILYRTLYSWQKKLRLSDWNITIDVLSEREDPELIDNDGYVLIRALDNEAQIFINEDAEDKREIVIHELWHVVLRDRLQVISQLFDGGELEDIWDYVSEGLVRLLTKVVADED